jgi:DNA polymerase-1
MVNDVEADDIIASAIKVSESKDIDAVIASADKDLMSLVSERTSMLDTKWQIVGYQDVEKKMGVKPEYIHLLLSIMGDAADNIPGLKGAGPKTAINWINEYKTIEELKANTADVKGKIGEKLRQNFNEIELSYELVELKSDIELDADVFDLTVEPEQNDVGLDEFLSRYNITK